MASTYRLSDWPPMADTPAGEGRAPITARLEAAAGRPGGRVTFLVGGTVDEVPWGQLHDEARAVGAALQARGIAPGDHVALLGPTSRALVTAIQGCWLAG